MSIAYDNYLVEHKNNVFRGYNWLMENLPDIIPFDVDASNNIGVYHDQSKFSKEEYDAYDAYFYSGNRSYSVVQDFNKAWLHHIHNNPHHWQHWILINDNPYEGEVILEMPYPYILEMICDWWAFSWAKDNLYEIFTWYETRKKYIKLHPDTRKAVESILDKIKAKLEDIDNGKSN